METEKAIERVKEIKIEYGKMDGLKEYVEAIETILKELEKKEKMIDEMVHWINDRCLYVDDYSISCEIIQDGCYEWQCGKDCRQCIKQYFETKANKEAE